MLSANVSHSRDVRSRTWISSFAGMRGIHSTTTRWLGREGSNLPWRSSKLRILPLDDSQMKFSHSQDIGSRTLPSCIQNTNATATLYPVVRGVVSLHRSTSLSCRPFVRHSGVEPDPHAWKARTPPTTLMTQLAGREGLEPSSQGFGVPHNSRYTTAP